MTTPLDPDYHVFSTQTDKYGNDPLWVVHKRGSNALEIDFIEAITAYERNNGLVRSGPGVEEWQEVVTWYMKPNGWSSPGFICYCASCDQVKEANKIG